MTSPQQSVDTDLLVIGWGKAGKTLAGVWASAGRTVTLVERSPQMYGGTCINVACVPTKDLVESARARRQEDDPQEWFDQAVQGRDGLISTLNQANHGMLDGKEGVTLIDGEARFTGPREVAVATADGEVRVTASTVVVNTGSVPTIPPLDGADGPRVHDSTSIQHVQPFPRRLVVVGGGFIGLEFADMFAHFGSEVTVLDRGEELIPQVDRDTAAQVSRMLTDHGVTVHHGASVEALEDTGDEVVVRTSTDEFTADAVLLATGRTPATEGLGLEAAGIETDERGFITVDDQLRTTAEGVYAVGDVHAGPQFTYTSYDDHRIVKDAELGDGTRRLSDRVAVPWTMFTTPPMAQVGMTLDEARESDRALVAATAQVADIAVMPRPKILSETHGRITVIADAETHQIVGATLFCIDAQEVVNMVALAIRTGATVEDLRDGIWTHPSTTEAFNGVLATLEAV